MITEPIALSDEHQLIQDNYHKKIKTTVLRSKIMSVIPKSMHIALYDSVLRYKRGCAPGTIKAAENNRVPTGRILGSKNKKPNVLSKKPLQHAFKKLLEQETNDYKWSEAEVNGVKVERVEWLKGKMLTVSELLSKMQFDAMRAAFERDDLSTFSRLLNDFRIASGEIPTQEAKFEGKIDVNPYGDASQVELVKLVLPLMNRLAAAEKYKGELLPKAEIVNGLDAGHEGKKGAKPA